MNCVKKKLKNQDGVTILIALVGFLIAAMISVVIVTAAVTSAQRVVNDRKTNQAHLTLESAAQIIRDEMEGITYTYKVDADGKMVANSGSVSPSTNSLSKEITDAINKIESSSGECKSGDINADFTITLEDNDTVNPVKVTFIMKNAEDGASEDGQKYDLYFTLKIDDDSKQQLYLTMDGKNIKVNNSNVSNTYQVSWDVVSINEIGE